jgi:ABC-type xylose transport system substrate-binding protein
MLMVSKCVKVLGLLALAPNDNRSVKKCVESAKDVEVNVGKLQQLVEAECISNYLSFLNASLIISLVRRSKDKELLEHSES